MKRDEQGRRCFLGVDVGGTKLAAGLVDEAGNVLGTRSEPIRTDDMLSPLWQILEMSRALVNEYIPGDTPVAMGVAVPAVVDRRRGRVIWAPNIPNWRDVPVREFLEREISCPVFVDFDGHVSVLGEQWIGAARGAEDAVFLIVGTGIGAGLWLDGRLYRGASGIAGGVGWYPLELRSVKRGEKSARGFFEESVAGPGIAKAAQGAIRAGQQSIIEEMAGSVDEITARTVFDAFEKGDSLAVEIVERVVVALGMGISNIVSTLNPEVVIVGGGVGTRLGALNLLTRAEEVVKAYSQPQAGATVRLVAPKLGNLVGVVGAARLAVLEAGARC